jgi:hypothetical protein
MKIGTIFPHADIGSDPAAIRDFACGGGGAGALVDFLCGRKPRMGIKYATPENWPTAYVAGTGPTAWRAPPESASVGYAPQNCHVSYR